MQDSSRKYLQYAVGEILLVVIGILIALQVNNWNEDRKFRVKEQVYLKTLHADMKANILEIEDDIRQNSMVITAMDTMIMLANNGNYQSIKSDRLFGWVMAPGNYSKLQLEQSTIEEIINSGNLAEFRREPIRRRISGWEKSLIAIRELETFGRDLQNDYLETVGEFIPFYTQGYSSDLLPPSIRDQYFSNVELLNTLNNVRFIASSLNTVYRTKIQEIEVFMDLIEQELNR